MGEGRQRQEQATAKANTEILRFAQNDGGVSLDGGSSLDCGVSFGERRFFRGWRFFEMAAVIPGERRGGLVSLGHADAS